MEWTRASCAASNEAARAAALARQGQLTKPPGALARREDIAVQLAALSVLAKQLSATLEVINLGTVSVVEALPGVRDERIAAGTANFLQQAAMTETQLAAALQSGRDAVLRAKQSGAQLFIGGEMGIANTT